MFDIIKANIINERIDMLYGLFDETKLTKLRIKFNLITEFNQLLILTLFVQKTFKMINK